MAKLNKFKGFQILLSRHYLICFLCIVSILISSVAIVINNLLLLELVHICFIIISSVNLTYNIIRIISIRRALKEFKKIVMEVLLEQKTNKEL